MKLFKFIIPLSISALFLSCSKKTFNEGKVFAGKKYVSADTLNSGKQVYAEYCMACHGVKGDGLGVAAKGLWPIPRDFTLGLYKFGNVVSGELPHDEDFYRIIKKGLHGTAMLQWDIGEGQLDAVTQYIKTFAPKAWEDPKAELGKLIKPTVDPFGPAHKAAAIAKGKEVYHATAQCQSCHRAYVSHDELSTISEKVNGEKITEFEDDLYKVKLQPSEYGVNGLPPDFTWHPVRSALNEKELYLRLMAGIGGSSMPSWKGVLTDDEVWAVAYYVKHLMGLKDSKERSVLMKKIAALNKK